MHSRHVKAVVLFLVSYVVLYLLYAFAGFLPKWDAYGYPFLTGVSFDGYRFVDPLFLFMPFIGFALGWLSISWYLRHFKEENILSVKYALFFVILSYAAYFLALIGYFWNNAFLGAMAQGHPSPGVSSLGATWSFVMSNFFDQLLGSPFFLLVLSVLASWVSYKWVHSYWKEPLPHLV
jgi:hypothetical protein